MKKSLIALAALAAVSGVQAQSSITIYGIVDAGYSTKTSTAAGGTSGNALLATGAAAGTLHAQAATKETKTSGIAGNGAESTSRLGFRGTEDLGGGLKANFVFETGVNPAESTISAWNNRQAFVGLEGGFGVMTVGTVYSAAHSLAASFSASTLPNVVGDVMYVQSGGLLGQTLDKYGIRTTGAAIDVSGTDAADVIAANAALVTAKISTTGNANGVVMADDASAAAGGTVQLVNIAQTLIDQKAQASLDARLARASNISYNVRTNNTVTYMSPDMSGFKVGAQYSLPTQTKIQGGEEITSKATQFSVNYAAGKFAAAAVHTTGESKSITNTAAITAGQSLATLQTITVADAGTALPVVTSSSNVAITAAAASSTTVKVETKESIAALSYDLGVAKVSYIYAQRDAKDTVSDLSEKTTHSFGVKAPFGKATAFAIYSMGETKMLNGTANAAKFDLDGTQVGVSYALSKRSDVYAIYGTNKMDNVANANDIKDKQYAVGLRHSF